MDKVELNRGEAMTLHGVKTMSGDLLASRMDDMHERWDAMERHIEEQFHEYAKAYKLDLSKNDDESWVSELTSVAAAAFFGGWHCRHESNLNYAKEFAPTDTRRHRANGGVDANKKD